MTRNYKGVEILFQVTGKVNYAYGTDLGTEPALFKLINPLASGNVTVTYMDGTTDTDIDAETLSNMNALVTKVVAGSTAILITDFGLYK